MVVAVLNPLGSSGMKTYIAPPIISSSSMSTSSAPPPLCRLVPDTICTDPNLECNTSQHLASWHPSALPTKTCMAYRAFMSVHRKKSDKALMAPSLLNKPWSRWPPTH